MAEDVVKDLHGRIDKALGDLQRELAKIRTGRANTAILEGIRVDFYGTLTPLSGVGTINVPDPRLITIKPWDRSVIPAVEKAINEAGIGMLCGLTVNRLLAGPPPAARNSGGAPR